MLTIAPMSWQAGIDYVRFTHRPGAGHDKALKTYEKIAEQVAGELVLPQYTFTPWQFRGYVGRSLGPVAYGEGSQGCILQVSGPAAQLACERRPPYTGCPRLDIQASYWLGADFRSLAWEVAGETDKVRMVHTKPLWACRVVDGRGEGDTCYIGRRGSKSKFLRVYDKWRQQDYAPEWKFCWRFEAELTDGHAEYALGTLLDGDLAEYSVLGLLNAYFVERGVHLPEVRDANYYQPSRIKKPPEDIGRTLRWLEEQVRPALEKAYGRGLTEDEVRAILDL